MSRFIQKDERAADLSEVRSDEQLDWQALETWLKTHLAEESGLNPDANMIVSQFHGGHANLTYCVRFEELELVVRRPPKGHIAPGAHDMNREYRVLNGLAPAYKPAPTVYAFCDDTRVIGAPFIVVERRQGVIVRAEIPASLQAHTNVAERISYALIDAMRDLHALNPEAIGLGRLGKPAGFVDRQLKGWHERWHLSRQTPLPLFDQVHQKLVKHQPTSGKHCIVHNDLKLDNCMFDPADPDRVHSVFDWDMATLGDPLAELGTLLGYWREEGDGFNRAPTIELDMSGFPSRKMLVERYAQSGVDLANIDWYEAFALWKHAVVLQQLLARLESGESKDERFRAFVETIPGIVEGAGQILG